MIRGAVVNGLYWAANLLCLLADSLSREDDQIWRTRAWKEWDGARNHVLIIPDSMVPDLITETELPLSDSAPIRFLDIEDCGMGDGFGGGYFKGGGDQ